MPCEDCPSFDPNLGCSSERCVFSPEDYYPNYFSDCEFPEGGFMV